MKTKTQKLNNVIGQIKGVQKMMDDGKDCLSILTQLKAVRSAVGGIMDSVVEEQMAGCMKSLNVDDQKLFKRIKNYVKSN